jgi:hypothetical protein
MYIRPESLENAVRNPELTARTPKRSMYIERWIIAVAALGVASVLSSCGVLAPDGENNTSSQTGSTKISHIGR